MRVLVVGIHSSVKQETARNLANELRDKTGLEAIIIDQCSAIIEVEVGDQNTAG